MLLLRSGRALSSVIVPVTLKLMAYVLLDAPLSAVVIAARSVLGPVSASELTVRVTCEGTVRSSSTSSRGRKRGAGGWRLAWCRPVRFEDRFRSQDKNHMMLLLSRPGLR